MLFMEHRSIPHKLISARHFISNEYGTRKKRCFGYLLTLKDNYGFLPLRLTIFNRLQVTKYISQIYFNLKNISGLTTINIYIRKHRQQILNTNLTFLVDRHQRRRFGVIMQHSIFLFVQLSHLLFDHLLTDFLQMHRNIRLSTKTARFNSNHQG